MEEIILGTEAKVGISFTDIQGFNAYDDSWEVRLYTNPRKKVVIDQYHCIPSGTDGKEFIVPFDSAEVGVGVLNVELVVNVPDEAFVLSDGKRTEIIRIESVGTIIP